MAVPELVPVPPAAIIDQLLPDEIQQYVDAWLALIQYGLTLGDTAFEGQAESVAKFLSSYFNHLSSPLHAPSPGLLRLKPQAYLLSHRVLSQASIPLSLLQWPFLANLSQQYKHSQSLQELLNSLWRRKRELIEASLETTKRSLATSKLSGEQKASALEAFLNGTISLVQTLPVVGEVICTGSDFLDTLIDIFPVAPNPLKTIVVISVYFSLLSLLEKERPHVSLLHDQLYVLKADGQRRHAESLIAALVSDTPLVNKIIHSPVLHDRQRTLDLATSLREFRRAPSSGRAKRPKRAKGKEHVAGDHVHGVEIGHVHRMSLITQVKDLFPELGSAFVAKLLSEYRDDVEKATSHLLENTLPPGLQTADRTEELSSFDEERHPIDFSPAPTPPPERRNMFDNDELDTLNVDVSKLHIGKKEREAGDAPNKAAILSALAAFDSDDDERDDTYDVEDVGGTVDNANAEAGTVGVDDRNEEALYRAYKSDPTVFERDAATRRGRPRQSLKNETGLTDEAIEGWLIVNARDPRKMRRLETKHSAWTGQQHELQSTSWRQSPADSGAEETEYGSDSRGGRGRGRPRGRFRGRGGNVAGRADEKGTSQARDSKETNKGSRANHNRRDQRARKMARGGL